MPSDPLADSIITNRLERERILLERHRQILIELGMCRADIALLQRRLEDAINQLFRESHHADDDN